MDGTPVSNANSPMNGHTFPDLRSIFFRDAQTGETLYTSGGSSFLDLTHSHGGATQFQTYASDFNEADGGDNWEAPGWHQHTMSIQVSTAGGNPPLSFTGIPTVPRYIALQVYMRIA